MTMYDSMLNGMQYAGPSDHHMAVAVPRPQVSIERLPARRPTNEPRESMNCKSCRKRKIKCNRLRPSCEACQVFQCPCIYDAVPKKRGPKTDVLEALLKRVDGLEAQLKDAKGEATPATSPKMSKEAVDEAEGEKEEPKRKRQAVDVGSSASPEPTLFSTQIDAAALKTEALFDTYFSRFHGKPFYILDESFVRQRFQLKQLPSLVTNAICAVAARHTPHPAGPEAAAKASEDYVARSRADIDLDEPSVDALQALLLLVLASMAAGKGKRAYVLITSAIGMVMALEVHREMDSQARTTPVERETRRRLFWSCYLLDRFIAAGAKRPSLIDDKAIILRLPAWQPASSSLPVEGDFFSAASNLQATQDGQMRAQGHLGGLIDIARILGLASRYVAAGGVKADTYFPWNSMSTHAMIRRELDTWASGTDDVFGAMTSPDALFRQPDAAVVVLGKLAYHLVHCLIYRPFLPIDLAELTGPGQCQPWQVEATETCFIHANAITDLVGIGRQATAGSFEWPAFVGYCVATAGTIHVHGAHYNKSMAVCNVTVYGTAVDYLARDVQHLDQLRHAWACVQHQHDTLQGVGRAHAELMKQHHAVAGGMRYTPALRTSDFFQRYHNIGGPSGPSFRFETAHLSLVDVTVDYGHHKSAAGGPAKPVSVPERRSLKRKNTAPVGPPMHSGVVAFRGPPTPHRHSFSHFGPPPGVVIQQQIQQQQQHSPGFLPTPTSLPSHSEHHLEHAALMHGHVRRFDERSAVAAAAEAAGFPLSPATAHPAHMAAVSGPFTPPGSGFVSSPAPSDLAAVTTAAALEPVFATLPSQGQQQQTFAVGSPATWHPDLEHYGQRPHHHGSGLASAPCQSPAEAMSPRSLGSRGGGGPGDDDAFLTLLESFAEGEASGMEGW